MGQIVSTAAKPKRCNANQLSQVPTPAAGEHILVSSDNSMNAAGQGNFDAYIVGDGTTAATGLPVKKLADVAIKNDSHADLDIVDPNGNVVARFSSGHIKTQNFDSSAIVKTIDDISADFDIIDPNGNSIIRLKDGHIKTQNFDSLKIVNRVHKVHFSFDDVEYSINSLFSGNYSSVWEHPFFAYLKSLHEDYGAVFTMNLFISTFSVITNAFASELGAVADWLKWTLHGDKETNYATRTEGASDWNNMVSAVITLTGTPFAIDRHSRLSNFAGTETQIVAMRGCDLGLLCLSASDDGRNSYDLTSNEQDYCDDAGHYYNPNINLRYVRSYTRLESNSLMWDVSTYSGFQEYIEAKDFSEFFTHEYCLFNSSFNIVSAMQTKLTNFFAFLKTKGYQCDFF